MVVRRMSNAPVDLPEDPAVLKAMIAALQAENVKMAATLRAHDQLIQTLRLRIAKLKKQVFGKSSEKIEREIEQLELALEDLLIAAAGTRMRLWPPRATRTSAGRGVGRACRRPPRASAGNSTRAPAVPTAAATRVWLARISARWST